MINWNQLREQIISILTTSSGVSLDMLHDFAVTCVDMGATPEWAETAFDAKPEEAASLLAIWSPYVDFLQSSNVEAFEVHGFPNSGYVEVPVPPKDGGDHPFFLLWIPAGDIGGNSREFYLPRETQMENRNHLQIFARGVEKFKPRRGNSFLALVHDVESQGVPIYLGAMNPTKSWKRILRTHLDKMTDVLAIYWMALGLNRWVQNDLSSNAHQVCLTAQTRCDVPTGVLNEMSYGDLLVWGRIIIDLKNTDGSREAVREVMREHFPTSDCFYW